MPSADKKSPNPFTPYQKFVVASLAFLQFAVILDFTIVALLAARIVTGIFGGVIGSVVMAIATDLFEPQQRGRVMGFIQTAFAASQILGLPAGIYLSNHLNWHAPFLVMVAFGVVGGLVIA